MFLFPFTMRYLWSGLHIVSTPPTSESSSVLLHVPRHCFLPGLPSWNALGPHLPFCSFFFFFNTRKDPPFNLSPIRHCDTALSLVLPPPLTAPLTSPFPPTSSHFQGPIPHLGFTFLWFFPATSYLIPSSPSAYHLKSTSPVLTLLPAFKQSLLTCSIFL